MRRVYSSSSSSSAPPYTHVRRGGEGTRPDSAYSLVGSLLLLVALLVGGGLLLVGGALGFGEGLPALAENLADLACGALVLARCVKRKRVEGEVRTKLQVRVIRPNLVALLIGKEHVGGEAALGRVGV